jgi:hypothetical protein
LDSASWHSFSQELLDDCIASVEEMYTIHVEANAQQSQESKETSSSPGIAEQFLCENVGEVGVSM